jgi:hypothetical protein
LPGWVPLIPDPVVVLSRIVEIVLWLAHSPILKSDRRIDFTVGKDIYAGLRGFTRPSFGSRGFNAFALGRLSWLPVFVNLQ